MANSIDPSAPWQHPEARTWDGITLAQWLAQHVKERTSCVDCATLNGFTNAAQQDRIVGGSLPVASGMAEMRGPTNIRLKRGVRRVRWNDAGATVSTDGFDVQARHVILAGPRTLTGAIKFVPSLPRTVL